MFTWKGSLLATSLPLLTQNTLKLLLAIVAVFQLLSCLRLFVTPWTEECLAFLSITISPSLLFISPNSCSLSQWCHPTISSSVAPFSSWPQSFPASGSFPVSQLLASGGQSIGASASASVLPINIQDWLPLGWTGLISLQSKGLSKTSPAPQFESASSLALNLLYGPTLTSIHD